jgi:hypothetical protein
MDEDRSLIAPLIAIMLTAILAAYVVAYFQMGTVSPLGPGIVRTYRGQLQAEVFTPPAVVESWISGKPVYVGHF